MPSCARASSSCLQDHAWRTPSRRPVATAPRSTWWRQRPRSTWPPSCVTASRSCPARRCGEWWVGREWRPWRLGGPERRESRGARWTAWDRPGCRKDRRRTDRAAVRLARGDGDPQGADQRPGGEDPRPRHPRLTGAHRGGHAAALPGALIGLAAGILCAT